MIPGLIVLIIVVAFAIIVKKGWRFPLGQVVGAVCILALLFWGGSCMAKKAKDGSRIEAARRAAALAKATQPEMVEALVLRYKGITPCSVKIGYGAQVWGDGPDFWVQFPGVKDPVLYSRGKFTAPDGVKVGETFFKAANPAQPVVVRVYEKIKVVK